MSIMSLFPRMLSDLTGFDGVGIQAVAELSFWVWLLPSIIGLLK